MKKIKKVVTKKSKFIFDEVLATSLNSTVSALLKEHKDGEAFYFDNANIQYQKIFLTVKARLSLAKTRRQKHLRLM